MADDPLWSDAKVDESVYTRFVEPIHRIMEADEDDLWLDEDLCRMGVSQEDQITEVHGYFRVQNSRAEAVLGHLYKEELRREVDTTIVRFERIEAVDDRTDVVYHHSRFPLNILRQRDAIIWRHLLERDPERGLFTLVWRACTHPLHPPGDKIVRIRSNGCYRIVQQGSDVDVYSLVRSDLGGSIPMTLIRLSTVPLVLRFRRRLQELCGGSSEQSSTAE